MNVKTMELHDMGTTRCDTIDGIFGEKDASRRAV
jgi:hypothetical protein